ncbi:MAG: hypothetical protein ACKVPX_12965 [Myxococcaceae bacterium]
MKTCLIVSLLLLSACASQIQSGLDESDANAVQGVLAAAGIESLKVASGGKKPTWSVEVKREHGTAALRVLAEAGLPRAKAEGFREVYGHGALVPSSSEERALYQSALSGELARTVESFEGVASARVHLALPPPPRPGQSAAPAKASVFVRARPEAGNRLRDQRVGIQSLVAGAVEGLSAEAVAVVIDEISVRSTSSTVKKPPHASASIPLLTGLAIAGVTLVFGGLRGWRWPRKT